MIIGAAKSGTTSLFNYLSSHPELSVSCNKEVHYFDWNYEKGDDWYEQKFSSFRKYRLDATPYYIFHPMVPARVHAYNPDCKFILVMRDPVDRAISHYYHNLRLIKLREVREDIQRFIPLDEHLPILEAFHQEDERIRDQYAIAKDRANDRSYNNHVLQHYSYKARGRYAEQLERWYEYFPPSRFLLLDFDTLSEDPRSALEEVYTFLGIRRKFPKKYTVDNKGAYKETEEMLQLKSELRKYFKPYDEELTLLTGRRFSWMKD